MIESRAQRCKACLLLVLLTLGSASDEIVTVERYEQTAFTRLKLVAACDAVWTGNPAFPWVNTVVTSVGCCVGPKSTPRKCARGVYKVGDARSLDCVILNLGPRSSVCVLRMSAQGEVKFAHQFIWPMAGFHSEAEQAEHPVNVRHISSSLVSTTDAIPAHHVYVLMQRLFLAQSYTDAECLGSTHHAPGPVFMVRSSLLRPPRANELYLVGWRDGTGGWCPVATQVHIAIEEFRQRDRESWTWSQGTRDDEAQRLEEPAVHGLVVPTMFMASSTYDPVTPLSVGLVYDQGPLARGVTRCSATWIRSADHVGPSRLLLTAAHCLYAKDYRGHLSFRMPMEITHAVYLVDGVWVSVRVRRFSEKNVLPSLLSVNVPLIKAASKDLAVLETVEGCAEAAVISDEWCCQFPIVNNIAEVIGLGLAARNADVGQAFGKTPGTPPSVQPELWRVRGRVSAVVEDNGAAMLPDDSVFADYRLPAPVASKLGGMSGGAAIVYPSGASMGQLRPSVTRVHGVLSHGIHILGRKFTHIGAMITLVGWECIRLVKGLEALE